MDKNVFDLDSSRFYPYEEALSLIIIINNKYVFFNQGIEWISYAKEKEKFNVFCFNVKEQK